MFSLPDSESNEEYVPIESGLEHVVSVLNETWPCKAWLVLRKTPSRWKVTHLRDTHYKINIGDHFPEGNFEDFPLEAGVGCHFSPTTLPIIRESGNNELSVGGHIFHRILSSDGSVYGGILGITPNDLKKDSARAMPVISLLAELVMTTRSVCRDAEEIGRRKVEVEIEASKDKLTGLFNLRGWEERTEEAMARFSRNKSPISLLVIDLNNFKQINDTQGHSQGDLILKETASVLQESVRKGDVVARVGGDEFVIMALDTPVAGAVKMAESLESTLFERDILCAVGAAEVKKEESLESALENADLNMYERKRVQQNTKLPFSVASARNRADLL